MKLKRITSEKNEKMKRWKKLHTRRGRERLGTFLIEGFHLVEEAIKAGEDLHAVLVQESSISRWEKALFSLHPEIPVYELPSTLFNKIAKTETPQEIMAEVKLKKREEEKYLGMEKEATYLLLDGIQDPGNLGTIIRTALACNVTAVWLGKGSVDLYNEKVIRATMGAIFHLPVFSSDLLTLFPRLQGEGVTIVGTSSRGEKSLFQYHYPHKTAILLGNEGRGIQSNYQPFLDEELKIPMPGMGESLNVSIAGAMLLYERIRQQER